MSDVEERWGKALRETEVSSLGTFLGRVVAALLVVGLSSWTLWSPQRMPFPFAVALVGCLFAFVWRRQKVKRREELVDHLMNKISNGMDAKEFGVVLSLLGDMGPSAARALPVIEECEKLNAGFPEVVKLCVMARARISGGEVRGMP